MKDISKVLIIDDDSEIAESIAMTLKMRWSQAKYLHADIGQDGINMTAKESPDMVFLDLGLPDISGFDVLKQIRLLSKVPVVILTVRSEEYDVVKGLELGADEYIVKPFRQMELLARVRSMMKRIKTTEDELPVVVGPLSLGPSICDLTYMNNQIRLTRTEGLIMKHLMQNADSAVTHLSISNILWGDYYPNASNSIKVYINQLRRKIEKDPRHPELILTRVGIGYFLASPVKKEKHNK